MQTGGDAATIDPGTVLLTCAALIAFASNSLLTRLALGAHEIDAASFTTVRLLSGAVVLTLLVRVRTGAWTALRGRGSAGPIALIAYAVPFSFAYLRIGAAVGALVLFGAVQLTMVGYAVTRGERPGPVAWLGLSLATGGLGLLAMRSAVQPDPVGLLLMACAGVAWGAYSIAGRLNPDPLAANARSFLWSAPVAVIVSIAFPASAAISPRGLALASVSGAVSSALGYAVWYSALPRMGVTQAAAAQLCVPIIAAIGAVWLLGEHMTTRLALCGVAVIAGVALVLVSRTSRSSPRPTR